MRPDAKYWWALSRWKGIGPKTGKRIIDQFKNDIAVLFQENSSEELSQIEGVNATILEQNRSELVSLSEEQIALAERYGVELLHRQHANFPYRMEVYDHLPFAFFYKGSIDLNPPKTVGIIGTRSPSEEGKLFVESFMKDLVPFQPVIISGLAYGIDISAHKAALASGLPTIAVLGSGIDQVYPSGHRPIARKMIQNGGVISQFPFGTGPDRENFPMRNQIIAALSDALIVIESKREGGSMITAEFANQMNKDVFAVPGNPGRKESEGCNLLIKSHQANLLESVDDLAYIMRWKKEDTKESVQRQLFVDLNPQEEVVYRALQKERKQNIDALGFKLSLSHSKLSPILLQLECKGLIKSLPGNQYIAL